MNQNLDMIPNPDINSAQQAVDILFTEEKSNRLTAIATKAGLGIVAVGGGYLAYKSGVGISEVDGLFDKKIIPEPPVTTEIVDGFVFVNESLRSAAPVVLAGGLATEGILKLKSRRSERSRMLNQLSTVDYSGVDAVAGNSDTNSSGLKNKAVNRARRYAAGIGLATFTALLTGGSSGIEHEVSNGPLRSVTEVFERLSVDDNRSLLIQSEDLTFMGESYLSAEDVEDFAEDAARNDIAVVAFSKSLPDINGRSGLVIGIPNNLFGEQSGVPPSESCRNLPIILDNASDKKAGDTVDINGIDTEVVAVTDGLAQMNRDVAIMAQSNLETCIQGTGDPYLFGAVISDADLAEAETVLSRSDLAGNAVIISQKRFEQNNRKFWRANGTPILLQMIAYVGAFGAFATASERRSAMQRNTREIGILNAQGVKMKDVNRIERRRALRDTGKATLVAAIAMPLFVGAFNAAEVGLRVGVGLREVAVGYGVTLAAKLTGSTRAVKRFSKKLSLSDSVKG